MPRSLVRSVLLACVAAASASPQPRGVAIDHAPIACATVDRFTEVDARLSPRDAVAKARVLFRAVDSEHWYFVSLTEAKDGRFVAHLPKPLPQLKAFEYYIDAQTPSFDESRTPERRVDVVGRNVTCTSGSLARSAASVAARLVVSALGGGPVLPAGFASSGIIAGAAAGAATTAGSGGAGATAGAGAAAGGGISGTTIAIVGGVAAAAGGAIAAGGGGGDSGGSGSSGTGGSSGPGTTPTPGTSPTPSPSPGSSPSPSPGGPTSARYNVTIPAPFIDVSNCSGQNTTFGGWVLQPAADGSFNEVHSIMTPVLRVTGQITATGMNANLACLNGNGTGSMSASGGGFSLSGTFTFNGRTGPFSVARLPDGAR